MGFDVQFLLGAPLSWFFINQNTGEIRIYPASDMIGKEVSTTIVAVESTGARTVLEEITIIIVPPLSENRNNTLPTFTPTPDLSAAPKVNGEIKHSTSDPSATQSIKTVPADGLDLSDVSGPAGSNEDDNCGNSAEVDSVAIGILSGVVAALLFTIVCLIIRSRNQIDASKKNDNIESESRSNTTTNPTFDIGTSTEPDHDEGKAFDYLHANNGSGVDKFSPAVDVPLVDSTDYAVPLVDSTDLLPAVDSTGLLLTGAAGHSNQAPVYAMPNDESDNSDLDL